MRRQSGNKVTSVKTFIQYIIEKQQCVAHLVFEEAIRQTEIIFIIKYVQIINHTLIGDISSGETNHLIEDRQCITHTTVRLHGYHVQRFRLCRDSFFRSNIRQMIHRIFHAYPVKVINLTTGKNGRENLMLLRRSQDKDSMTGRFFQRFQERIESRCREHVHLVDDIYLILTNLWRDTHLLHQLANVIHRVIRSSIEFVNII